MHRVGVSKETLQLIKKRRGGLRAFPDPDPGRMALVVIDMQNCFVAPGGAVEVPAARGIVPNINRLARACRGRGIPVIWVRHMVKPDGRDWELFFNHFLGPEAREAVLSQLSEGSWGSEMWKEMDVKDGDYIIEKCRYSALIAGSSKLERLLRGLGKDTIIITGTRTSMCCEATARDGMMLDFKVLFVRDGTATFSDAEHRATLNILAPSYADVLTTDEVIRDLAAP